MNLKTWTVGVAVLALAATPTFAEEGLDQWSYDKDISLVSCDGCCDCCCDDCCGDGCCDCGDGCGCGCGIGGGGLFSGIGPGWVEGFSLAGLLGVEAFDIGGWSQFGWTDDQVPLAFRADGQNNGGAFLDRNNRFLLNQQWFYISREADGSQGFDVGGRVDLMYGHDASKTQAFGNPSGSWDFENGWDRGAGFGWAMPQLYAEVAMGDFSVIAGHFYTLIGYEVVTAPDNFFYSHALTFFNSEPFTHTGVLGTYSGFENVTLYGGWTAGWDTGFDSVDGGSNWLGGFSASLGDSVTFTYISTYGNFGDISAFNQRDYSHSCVLDVALTDKLNYVFQSDYKTIDSSEDLAANNFIKDEDVGINQYVFYNFNDWLSFGTRIEWWSDDTVSYNAYTTGVNLKLLDNLVVRPEFRKDWAPSDLANAGRGPVSQENVACDMILTY